MSSIAPNKKSSPYSEEFKLKVLEYYFRNGGEEKFGLKAKTAQHFKIDSKTISRMLCNAEMVNKALKALNPGSPSSDISPKVASKPSQKSNSKVEGFCNNVKSSPEGNNLKSSERNISIMDLPEDPDYSLLKQMINTSASGASHVARLLVTATKEVQKMILNECDLIYECKVCKNLFRSIVNFLAHKRIYCQDDFANVKNAFTENNPLGVTPESSTVVVEPQPPPNEPQTEEEITSLSKVDQIAAKLANNNIRKRKLEEMSSPTDTGSPRYYDRLQNTVNARTEMTKSPCLMLKKIKTNKSAVYQTYLLPNHEKPDEDITDVLHEIRERKMGGTASIQPESVKAQTEFQNENGGDFEESSQASSDCISAHSECSLDTGQGETLRFVYTCPICNITFLSVSGCVKHLYKVHKKKKHQRERLRHVIRSRAYKRTFLPEEIKAHHNRLIEIKSDLPQKSQSEQRKNDRKPKSAEKAKTATLNQSDLPLQCRENANKNLLHCCSRCGRGFLTPGALGSHLKFCQLTTIKKIGIQIRKDYKKQNSIPKKEPHDIKPFSDLEIPQKSRIRPPKRIIKQEKLKLGFTGDIDVDPSLLDEVKEKLNKICAEQNNYCVPCKTKFSKRSVLIKHASMHLNWTRFICKKCNFRSYYKYLCDNHCISSHKISLRDLDQFIVKDEKLGKFRYYLDLRENPVDKDPVSVKKNDDFCPTVKNSPESALTDTDVLPLLDDTAIKSEEEPRVKCEITGDSLPSTNIDMPYSDTLSQIESPPLDEVDKDDTSLTKNQDTYAKSERPQRNRRSIEKEDFIYELKRPSSANSQKGSDSEAATNGARPITPELKKESFPSKQNCDEDPLCNGSSSHIPDSKREMRVIILRNESLEAKEAKTISSQRRSSSTSSLESSTSNTHLGS